jgi:hypothetical protein
MIYRYCEASGIHQANIVISPWVRRAGVYRNTAARRISRHSNIVRHADAENLRGKR